MIQTTLFPHTFKQLYSLSNDDIASVFEQVSDLLEAQGDDYYRIRAYRKGAEAVRSQKQPVVDLFESKGTKGLAQIPYIGRRLSQSIKELAETGDLSLLQRLSIDVSPEDLFTTVPGIGQVLARRLYRGLGLRSLADLEQAANAGQLAKVPGFGQERIAWVQASVASMLREHPQRRELQRPEPQERHSQKRQLPKNIKKIHRTKPEKTLNPSVCRSQPSLTTPAAQTKTPQTKTPPVALLLEVDQQYRYLARAGQLRMVTPKRFNPEKKPWLPVMQLNKAGWQFNVLYSNTARAHELGKTNDWVVINYERNGEKGQCTIVTESRGAQKGNRVVRGKAAIAA